MNVLTRAEFIELMKIKFNDINDNHSIWEPEKYDFRNNATSYCNQYSNQSRLFVIVKPLKLTYDDSGNGRKRDYWNWCDKNLNSKVKCYYSDSENQEEYWGFSGNELNLKNDVLVWLLKWTT